MKKASKKLVLCRETLRALTNLELVHAVGGGELGAVALADSGDFQCPRKVAVVTGAGG